MAIELKPVTESVLPLCRLLYADAIENSLFSASDVILQTFDQSLQRGDSYFKVAVVDDKVIGLVGLERIRLVDRVAQLVLSIVPEERGKKFSKIIFEKIITEAVDELNLRRLVSISLENSPPEKVLIKLGFNLEGVLVKDKWKNGSYRNAVILGWNKDDKENIPKTD